MTGPDIGVPDLTVVDLLGRGGSASVYAAVDPETGQELAVKVLDRTPETEAAEFRFEKEIRSLEALRTAAGVVGVLRSGTTATGEPYLVMPMLSGGSCNDLIKDGHGIPWEQAATIVAKASAAIQLAHNHGIWHRDIKPANILRTRSGETFVSDFGIARFSDGSGHTSGGASLTPNYAAPEVFASQPEALSDVFSLGATLAALVLGHAPFSPPGAPRHALAIMQRIANDLPPDLAAVGAPATLSAIAAKAMAKDAADRHQSAAELHDELVTLLADERGEDVAAAALIAQPRPLPHDAASGSGDRPGNGPRGTTAGGRANKSPSTPSWLDPRRPEFRGSGTRTDTTGERVIGMSTGGPAPTVKPGEISPTSAAATTAATGTTAPPTQTRERQRLYLGRPLLLIAAIVGAIWVWQGMPGVDTVTDLTSDLFDRIRDQLN